MDLGESHDLHRGSPLGASVSRPCKEWDLFDPRFIPRVGHGRDGVVDGHGRRVPSRVEVRRGRGRSDYEEVRNGRALMGRRRKTDDVWGLGERIRESGGSVWVELGWVCAGRTRDTGGPRGILRWSEERVRRGRWRKTGVGTGRIVVSLRETDVDWERPLL